MTADLSLPVLAFRAAVAVDRWVRTRLPADRWEATQLLREYLNAGGTCDQLAPAVKLQPGQLRALAAA